MEGAVVGVLRSAAAGEDFGFSAARRGCVIAREMANAMARRLEFIGALLSYYRLSGSFFFCSQMLPFLVGAMLIFMVWGG